jgi:hypothetical protein
VGEGPAGRALPPRRCGSCSAVLSCSDKVALEGRSRDRKKKLSFTLTWLARVALMPWK